CEICSLALVAYELLAGRPAYGEMETEELLRQRLDGPPPSLRSARVGVPDAVDRVVRRALARDPDDRHGKAGYFARDLLNATERGDATSAIAPPAPRKLRRRSWELDSTVALLAVIAVLVGTLVVFASFQGRTAPAPAASNAPGRSAAVTGAPNVVGRPLADAI